MSYWQLSPVFWRENCAPRFPRSHRLNFLPRRLFCFQNITKSVLLGIDKRYVLLFLYRNRNCALSFGIIAIVFPQLCELAMSIHIRPLYFNQTNFAHGQHPCGRILRWVDLWVDKRKPICARNMSRSCEHCTERSGNMWKFVYSIIKRGRNSRGAQRFVGFFLNCAFWMLIGWAGKSDHVDTFILKERI